MVTKICVGHYVPDTCHYAKFHYDPMSEFCPPPHMQSCLYRVFIRLLFWRFWQVATPRRRGHFDDQYFKRRCFAQGCAFRGSRNRNCTFRSNFLKKWEIFGRFSTAQKISAQNGF